MKPGEKDLVLGVDPGLSGAIAVLRESSVGNIVQKVWDMPVTVLKANRHLEVYTLSEQIRYFAPRVRCAVVEDVGAMTYFQKRLDGTVEKRGQGAAASFAFGKATGVVHGVLAGYMIKIYLVKPSVWKMQMGLTSDKNKSRELAAKLYPEIADLLTRVKDDGRAEALLLAHFGAKSFG